MALRDWFVRNWIAVAMVAGLGIAFWHFASPKTPDGVDVVPIRSIEVSADVKDVDAILRLLPAGVTHRNERESDLILFGTPGGRDRDGFVRKVQVSRFDERKAALADYQSIRRAFSTDRWKRFDARDDAENEYFSAYKGPWVNMAHGIPVGLVHAPEIVVAFRKKNLLIVVSYHSARGVWSYVDEINEDIAYVADVLRKSLGS